MSNCSIELIQEVLKHHNGNKTATARQLGITRSKVWRASKKVVNQSESLPVADQVQIQPVDEPAVVRELRTAERKIANLTQQLAAEERRRKLAESDLEEAHTMSRIFEELNEQETVGRVIEELKVSKSGGCTALIAVTDWHLEKNILPSTVSYLNEFNLDIAAQRIDRLWQKVDLLIQTWSQLALVDEVVLWLGGDLINNYLHEEDVESNFLGPTEAILEVEKHIRSGIDFLLPKYPLRRIVCNYGNHARTTKTCRPATGWKTSWEYLAYRHLAEEYNEILWHIPKGYFNYIDVQGYNVRLHHGENVNYWGGVGGLTIPMNKAIAAWDESKRADITLNGHFHQYIDTWQWVSCGCLCGYDAFAQSIKAKFQPPTQTITFIDNKRGKVCSLPIFVDKI